MEKTRQMKILSIIALVVAIAGMTLGFASFSTTLSISSSATVIPNSEDFKVVLSWSETDSNVKNLSYIAEGGATVHALLSENKDKPLFYKGLQAKLKHF